MDQSFYADHAGMRHIFRPGRFRLFRVPLLILVLSLFLFPEAARAGQDHVRWPPPGWMIRCPVVRDTLVSAVRGETQGNNGGAHILKLKGRQEFILFDIDPAPMVGRRITGALLHIRSASPKDAPLLRVGCSTVAVPWVEGDGTRYHARTGAACFAQASLGERDWACPGSTLMDVVFGLGRTDWAFADASPPDDDGWQTVAVAPEVVTARSAGVSHGFCLSDEVGSVWSLTDGRFAYELFPNRRVHSRESSRSGPWLDVWIDGEDRNPPAVPVRDIATAARPPVPPAIPWPAPDPSTPVSPTAPLPQTTSGLLISVVDLLDKSDPAPEKIVGDLVPERRPGYLTENHLFSAREQRVRLSGARGETVACQILVQRPSGKDSARENESGPIGIRASVVFPESDDPAETPVAGFHEPLFVAAGNRRLPDPLVPSNGRLILVEEKCASLILEVEIPREARPGRVSGRLLLEDAGPGGRNPALSLVLEMDIAPFALPRCLSFVPELNAYDTAEPSPPYAWYRLVREHRCCLNRLPYGWSTIPAFAPSWNGASFDWTDWDRSMAPLLEGSAFADLPDGPTPLEICYLPLNENWPVALGPHFTPSFWADEAFSPAYAEEWRRAATAFARHLDENGWRDTAFQFFLNDKVAHRARSSKVRAPWNFDEPVNIQDFLALRWYGSMFHDAVSEAFSTPGNHPDLGFRADVSFLPFGRTLVWDVADHLYLGGNDPQSIRLADDARRLGRIRRVVPYGTPPGVESDTAWMVLWCLRAWRDGHSGVLPWQSIGSPRSWDRAEATALLYPARGTGGPRPSLRLKALRAGQQLVEYLLLLERRGVDHRALAAWLDESLDHGLDRSTDPADDGEAPIPEFGEVSPERLWEIRQSLIRFLGESPPTTVPALKNAAPPPPLPPPRRAFPGPDTPVAVPLVSPPGSGF